MKKFLITLICVMCIFSIGFAVKYRGELVTAKAADEQITETPTESDGNGSKTDETGSDGQSTDQTENGDKKATLEAFLEFMQKTADEAGIGDEYRKAVEAIKTAASEKQVTISTVASVAQLAVFVVYLIYLNAKNGRLKRQMVELSEKLDKQLKGTNGLIDESNANGATVDETKKDVESLKRSMNYLLNGLATFVERFNIGAASKESVRKQFNKAANEVDGVIEQKEVTANEENKAQ